MLGAGDTNIRYDKIPEIDHRLEMSEQCHLGRKARGKGKTHERSLSPLFTLVSETMGVANSARAGDL